MKEHIEGGTELIYIDGQWYSKHDIDYLNSQNKYSEKIKSDTQKKLEKKTTSHAGFSKSKISSNFSDDREETLERLSLLKNQRARLLKDLERVNSVIKSIETDLII